MCGLCGFTTKKGFILTPLQMERRSRAMECLLVANETRGKDSTGIALIGEKATLLKRTQIASLFVKEPIIKKALKYPVGIMMGHTRLATMGEVTEENAHPFKEGNIIGAHNGVISNYASMDANVNVDSQAIIRTLDLKKNDYQAALKQVKGSCALTWVNMRHPQILYMVSHVSPLCVAVIPEIQTIFWSSQMDHLKPAMFAFFRKKNQEFFTLAEDKVYKINHNLEVTQKDVAFWEEDKAESSYRRGWTSPYAGGYHGGSYHRIRSDDDFEDEMGYGAYAPWEEASEEREIRKMIGSGKDKKKAQLRYYDFAPQAWEDLQGRAAEEGCALCGKPMWLETYYDDEDGSLLCEKCYAKEPQLENYFDHIDLITRSGGS